MSNAGSNILYIYSVLILYGYISGVLGECPDGFLKYRDSCYHFSHDTETWVDAANVCKTVFQSKLVEIEDEMENNYLLNEATALNGEFWTGGNDLQVEGEWRWLSTGDLVTLHAWGGGGPSNSNGDENCMELNAGNWNDDACHKTQRYICERSIEVGELVG